MKDIKFRMWDSKYKRYYYNVGFFFNPCDQKYYISQEIEGHINKFTKAKDEVIIEQFTGVSDSTGEELFDGDILEIRYLNDLPNVLLKIQWDVRGTGFHGVRISGVKEGYSDCYSLSFGGSVVDGLYKLSTINELKEKL